jgi:hypothetical protein
MPLRVRSSRGRDGFFAAGLMLNWAKAADQESAMAVAAAKAAMRREDAGALVTGHAARLAIRRNAHSGPTSGLAPGYVQANLAILPSALAQDFMQFCQRNPKPCPLVGVGAPGDPRIPELAGDLDIRTDLPRYRVWRDGVLVDEPADIVKYWRDDLVTFAIGCSFSFEQALVEGGIELRHMTCDCTVPMYRTAVETVPAGPFHGPLVVSMRPAGIDRHCEYRQARLGRRGADPRRRDPGVLGLRGNAAIGDHGGEAGILHHPLSRRHAGDGPAQHRICNYVTPRVTFHHER